MAKKGKHKPSCFCKPCYEKRKAAEAAAAQAQPGFFAKLFGNAAKVDDTAKRQYDQATSRPQGTQEAGNTWVKGQPAYYEDGGSTGREGHRDRYYGPNGPFGPNHHHEGSKDGGETWDKYH